MADAVEQLQQYRGASVLSTKFPSPVTTAKRTSYSASDRNRAGVPTSAAVRLPQAPAETVADRPVVDFGHEARHILRAFRPACSGRSRSPAPATSAPRNRNPRLPARYAPVACGDLAGYFAQYRQAYAQYVFHARHQCRGEFHVFGSWSSSSRVAEWVMVPGFGAMPPRAGGSPCGYCFVMVR